MRIVTAASALAAALLLASQAGAQDSAGNASRVSAESGEAAAALAESGVKTAVGVSAVPVGSAAVGSAAAGSAVVAAGSGVLSVAGAASDATADSAAYANQPLKVDDDVVVAQPAPVVPYQARQTTKQQGRR